MKPSTGGTADAARLERELTAEREKSQRLQEELELLRSHGKRGEEILARRTDELEQTQAELRASYRFLESIIENLPDMIFVKDARELRFVRFNRAGEELLGYSREELIGKNDYDFFPAEEADFFTQKDRAALHLDHHEDIPEEPIHTRHQGLRWLHTKKIPIRDESGTPIYLLGISEDITDKKQVIAELASRTRELERSNDDLQQYAYVASHDLQEPLRMIASYLQLLDRRYGHLLEGEAAEFIAYAVDGAVRMQKLINDLLTYSQVRRQDGRRAPTDAGEALQAALKNLSLAVTEADAQITAGPLPRVNADGAQLEQLFQNLVANALKFRSDAPPRIEVAAERSADGWRFTVRDNGIGISPQFHRSIFGMFTRLHPRGRYPGNGLGLALCRKIVECHDGAIWVESEEGQGTTFHFTLPDG